MTARKITPADDVEIDYTALTEAEVQKGARADHAAAKAAKEAGEKIPATPFLDELNRRYEGGANPASKRAAKEKGKGTGTGRTVRLEDGPLVEVLTELVTTGKAGNRAQAVKVLRETGRGTNQQRVAKAWAAMVAAGVKVPDAPAAAEKATTSKAPAAEKAAAPKQSPAQRRTAAAKASSPKAIGLAQQAQKAVSERRRKAS